MFGYGSGPGTGFGVFIVCAIALTIVGVPLYFAVFSHGWNALSVMPYAIPVAAVAVALLVAVGKRAVGATSAAPGTSYGFRRANPGLVMVIGLGMVVAGGIASFGAGRDTKAYDREPSCAAGFALEPERAGACRLERVRIVDEWTGGGKSRTRHLTLERTDGTTLDAQPATNRRGSVWDGVRSGDRLATVQLYNGHPVQVETQSGLVTTSNYPREREKSWALLGLLGGGLGLFAAISILIRGIF